MVLRPRPVLHFGLVPHRLRVLLERDLSEQLVEPPRHPERVARLSPRARLLLGGVDHVPLVGERPALREGVGRAQVVPGVEDGVLPGRRDRHSAAGYDMAIIVSEGENLGRDVDLSA